MRIAFVPEEFVDKNPTVKGAGKEEVEAMTRDQALELYRPIRASIWRICGRRSEGAVSLT